MRRHTRSAIHTHLGSTPRTNRCQTRSFPLRSCLRSRRQRCQMTPREQNEAAKRWPTAVLACCLPAPVSVNGVRRWCRHYAGSGVALCLPLRPMQLLVFAAPPSSILPQGRHTCSGHCGQSRRSLPSSTRPTQPYAVIHVPWMFEIVLTRKYSA